MAKCIEHITYNYQHWRFNAGEVQAANALVILGLAAFIYRTPEVIRSPYHISLFI